MNPSQQAREAAERIDIQVRQFTGHEEGLPDFAPIIQTAIDESRQWRDIESAPKDGTPLVLAEFTDRGWCMWQDHWRKYAAPFGEGFGEPMNPTHWTYLPPPKGAGE